MAGGVGHHCRFDRLTAGRFDNFTAGREEGAGGVAQGGSVWSIARHGLGWGHGALDAQSKTEMGDVGWGEDGKEPGGEDLFRIQGSRCYSGSPYLSGRQAVFFAYGV